MIVTPRFVFLHLHKSGGTFVNRFLLEHVPGSRAVGYHLPRTQIPEDVRQLPILGTVRNPWDYYVSWYTFQSGMPRPNPIFQLASDGGRRDFEGTINALLDLGAGSNLLDHVIAALPEHFPGRGINLTRQCLAPIRNTGLGFYAFLYRRMYGDGNDAILLTTDHLREQLESFLAATGHVTDADALAALRHAPALNTTTHRPYPAYYSPSLAAKVASRDAIVIERHGFHFSG